MQPESTLLSVAEFRALVDRDQIVLAFERTTRVLQARISRLEDENNSLKNDLALEVWNACTQDESCLREQDDSLAGWTEEQLKAHIHSLRGELQSVKKRGEELAQQQSLLYQEQLEQQAEELKEANERKQEQQAKELAGLYRTNMELALKKQQAKDSRLRQELATAMAASYERHRSELAQSMKEDCESQMKCYQKNVAEEYRRKVADLTIRHNRELAEAKKSFQQEAKEEDEEKQEQSKEL